MTMINDYRYLMTQLNLLIGFLDVSEEEVYNKIKHHDQFNLGTTIEELYDYQYTNYSNHIATSALLLGFAHIEDFLTKCVVKILVINPHENDLKVNIKTIQEKGDYLILFLAETQSKQLKFHEKIKILQKNIPGIDSQFLLEMNGIRNCIMHNNGVADNKISPRYRTGERIVLTSSEVNEFGLKARQFVNQVAQGI